MDRYDRDQTSIFPRPPEDDLEPSVPAPAHGPTPQPSQQPIRARPAPEFSTPRGDASEGLSRQVVVLGSMGLAILALTGFIAVSLLQSDARPATAVLPTASPTASPVPTAEPTDEATPEPTSTPIPTPEPTPAGPPVEVPVGGWATVTIDELDVRASAGSGQPSVYRLVRGAVVNIAEGPAPSEGTNWYRIASLGGATGWVSSGWIAAPHLDTLAGDPALSECGQVRRSVFEIVNGSAVPNDPLRIGDLAVPAAAFSNLSLGILELMRGMGQEVCFSARLGSDGMPALSTELNVSACGHADVEGGIYRLGPADDGSVPLASQVLDPTILHPAVLDGGPADDRMSTNLRTLVRVMANDGTSGCVNMNVTQRASATESYRSVSARQCSIVHQYNEHSIKFAPVSGGEVEWVKLPSGQFERGRFPLETPVMLSVDASVSDDNRWAGAWRDYGGECG